MFDRSNTALAEAKLDIATLSDDELIELAGQIIEELRSRHPTLTIDLNIEVWVWCCNVVEKILLFCFSRSGGPDFVL